MAPTAVKLTIAAVYCCASDMCGAHLLDTSTVQQSLYHPIFHNRHEVQSVALFDMSVTLEHIKFDLRRLAPYPPRLHLITYAPCPRADAACAT
eukprot:4621065-Pleurochrysis_carterae.AAC.1